jgi:hypothetical protein
MIDHYFLDSFGIPPLQESTVSGKISFVKRITENKHGNSIRRKEKKMINCMCILQRNVNERVHDMSNHKNSMHFIFALIILF